ncbi:MAG: hypothetical protein SO157_08295 [Bullifex sp.]|nr:hypothetical protein [Spirochaetales bacterium]MDY2816139.1 hypothetical protein [Bullifex sp.]MDD7008504.1 hypothetical protein [Spirochaetales bacterium]MDD7537351.1 hypothetical protein [Spirochaetales bacterium]MDY4799326.1 hypothetical protein [Bullifex sp.]
MKKLFATLLVCLMMTALFAAFNPAYSDYQFYNLHDYATDKAYLEKALTEASSADEKAEILWRLARVELTLTDDIDDDKEFKQQRLDGYAKAEALAVESLSLKETYNAYHWQASAIGRIGQVNGPLNSLGKAKPMRELVEKVQNEFNADYTDSWYVLGILYNQLPGGPISFGDKDAAISYMRRCVDTQDNVNRTNLTNYLELAEQLEDRDWSASKRAKEFEKMKKKYDAATVPTEKMKYYEGKDGKSGKPFYSSVTLDKMSDKQEAVMLLRYALAFYEKSPIKFATDAEKLEEIRELIDDLT